MRYTAYTVQLTNSVQRNKMCFLLQLITFEFCVTVHTDRHGDPLDFCSYVPGFFLTSAYIKLTYLRYLLIHLTQLNRELRTQVSDTSKSAS